MKKIFGVIIIIWCTCERWSMYIIFKWLLANGICTIKFVFCKMAKTQTFGQVKLDGSAYNYKQNMQLKIFLLKLH